MSSVRPTITAIVNLHAEGLLAHQTLRSVLDARAVAARHDLSVEMLVVADRPDEQTSNYLDTAKRLGAGTVVIDEGDLGAARNAGIEAAAGRYVAFLDGDDLWGDTWLALAHAAAQQSREPVVLHPEASLYFGDVTPSFWLMHHDQDTARGDWTNLGLRNHWTSLSFADRDTYARVPFSRNAIGRGFGYEDWSWNCETISQGIAHQVVPGTVHLIRVRERSLLRQTSQGQALMTPSDLFIRRLKDR